MSTYKKTRGRPKQDNTASVRLNARVTPEFKETLRKLAEHDGVSETQALIAAVEWMAAAKQIN